MTKRTLENDPERPERRYVAPEDETARVLSRALELLADGEEDCVAIACEGRPDLRGFVAKAVRDAMSVESIVRTGQSFDQRAGECIGGRYKLVARLGAGAMGVVYRALDMDLRREVAVKLLMPGLMEPARAESRFDREARAMASVDHESLIQIHDRGRSDSGEGYIVMDLIAGTSLASFVEDLAFRSVAPDQVSVSDTAVDSPARAESSYVRWVAQTVASLAGGVEVAHEAGVIHRDIKPSNVLLRPDGTCVLIDFGIAHMQDDADLTRGGSSVGTPAFMAPECTSGAMGASAASDVYGLASVAYYLLTLRAPYQGSPVEIMAKLGTRDPEPPARLHPGLARDLAAIVEKGMARAPGARYAGPRLLAEDLQRFLGHRPVVARPVRAWTRAVRRIRRSPASLAVLGTVLLAGLIVGARGLQSLRHSWLDEKWVAVQRHLQPNFSLCAHLNRPIDSAEDRAALKALLNRGVDVARDRLYPLLLRASFLLDHGDVRGAARDMRSLAADEGTDYAAALAHAYGAVEDGEAGSRSVDRSQLPDPVTARDRYLAAYHHGRDYEDAQAIGLLDEEVLSSVPGAIELRFVLDAYETMSSTEQRERALTVFAELQRYEERLGTPTAWSRHWAALTLAYMDRYPESLVASRKSIELAPRSHVNRTNAGYAAFALDLQDEARMHFRTALDVTPTDWKSARTLVWTYIREAAFREAHAAVDEHGVALDEHLPGWSNELRATIEIYRALGIHRERLVDVDADRMAAQVSALARADEYAKAAKAASGRGLAGAAANLAEALATGDDVTVFKAVTRSYQEDPHAWWRLELMSQCLPPTMDPDQVLSTALQRIAGQMASIRSSEQ